MAEELIIDTRLDWIGLDAGMSGVDGKISEILLDWSAVDNVLTDVGVDVTEPLFLEKAEGLYDFFKLQVGLVFFFC